MDLSVKPTDRNIGEVPRRRVNASQTWKRAQAKKNVTFIPSVQA